MLSFKWLIVLLDVLMSTVRVSAANGFADVSGPLGMHLNCSFLEVRDIVAVRKSK